MVIALLTDFCKNLMIALIVELIMSKTFSYKVNDRHCHDGH